MKKKIIIAVICISMIFLAGGIYLVTSIQQATSTLDYLIKLHQVEIVREHLLLQIKKVQSDLTLWDTPHSRSIEQVVNNVGKLGDLSATCFDCHHSPAVVERLIDLAGEIDKYKESLSRSLTMRANRERIHQEKDAAFYTAEKLTEEVQSMVHMTANKLYSRTESSLKNIYKTKTVLYMLIAITPLCAAVLGYLIIRILTKPIQILLTATRTIKSGDLDFRIKGLKDEFAELATSFNEMADSIKKNMHAVLESEKRYQLLFNGAGDAIFLIEAEGEHAGKIIEANQTAADMHGYSMDELLQLNLLKDIDTPETAEKAPERINKIMNEKWVTEEITHVRKDGTIFPVEMNAGLLDFMGKTYILGIDRDISDRKKMQNQILQSKLDWENTFDTITDMITIHDNNYNIVRANKSAIETLGLFSSKNSTDKCFKIFHGKIAPPNDCLSCQCFQTKKSATFEVYEPHLDMFLEVRAMPRIVNNKINGLIHVVRDITERKRVEEAMQRAEQMKLVGEWAAGLAHEIKNPLAGIKISVEVLLEELDISNEDRTIVLRAVDEIKRIETLLKSLLNFAKPAKLELADVNVNTLLEKTIAFSMRHPTLSLNSSIKIDVLKNLDEHIPEFLGDPIQLQQVFLNLMFNAIEAMPDGGTLGITSFYNHKENKIHIEISDTGKGIDKKTISKLFKPFFTTKSKGSGLGLAISRRIIEQHGGLLSVESIPDTKTVFTIVLKTKGSIRKANYE